MSPLGYYIDSSSGALYQGAQQPGDREATEEEVASHTLSMQEKITQAIVEAKLLALDLKSIRAIREGDTARIAQHNAEAESLRTQLPKRGPK